MEKRCFPFMKKHVRIVVSDACFSKRMAPFSDSILQAMSEKHSALCVGLDPHFDLLPGFLKDKYAGVKAIEIFLKEIIDAVSPFTAVVKPNTAFFEIWGGDGWKVLEKVCKHAKKRGLFVIADAKRGDIGSTAQAYAEAFLGSDKPYDALTVNPYVGQDGLLPFVEVAAQNGKGIFVLVKTSNPGAGEFQDLPVGDALFHEEVARMVARIGFSSIGSSGFSAVGAVVGATEPDDIRILRTEMPTQLFLIPGFGTQGGSAVDVTTGFYKSGHGAIVNASRSIIFAGNEKSFAEKASLAARKAQQELSTAIAKIK